MIFTGNNPSTMNINVQFSSTNKSAIHNNSNHCFNLKDYILWIATFIFSFIPFSTPLLRDYVNSSNFVLDINKIFNNKEILYICVSMSLAALFELLRANDKIFVRSIIVIFNTFICLVNYCTLPENGRNPYHMCILNLVFLAVTFSLGTISFINKE